MDNVSVRKYHKTSVSIRGTSFRRLKAALRILQRNRMDLSEHELCRRLLGIYLKLGKGSGGKAEHARRYNIVGMNYVRRAAYFNHGLYSILWQRGTHRGESISRMLDFAIRNYLPQVIEELLDVSPYSPRLTRNTPYWRERHCNRFNRKKTYRSGFLTYASNTSKHQNAELKWEQQVDFRSSNYRPVPVSSPKSPYFYLRLPR